MKKKLVVLSAVTALSMAATAANAATVKVYATGNVALGTAAYLLANERYNTATLNTVQTVNPTTGALVSNGIFEVAKNEDVGTAKLSYRIDNNLGQFANAAPGADYVLCQWVDGNGNGSIDKGELYPLVSSAGVPFAGRVVGGILTFETPISGSSMFVHGNPANAFDRGLDVGSNLVVVQVASTDVQPTLGASADGLLAVVQNTDNATSVLGTADPDGAGPLPAVVGSGAMALNFIANAGLPQNTQLSVSVAEDGSATYQSAAPLATFSNEFAATVAQPADGVVDVNAVPSRTKFDNGTVVDTISIAICDQNATAACNPSQNLVGRFIYPVTNVAASSDAKINIDLISSNQAIKSVVGTGVPGDGTLTYNATAGKWTDSNQTVTLGGTTVATYTFTTDGTVINTRSFTTNVNTTPATNFAAVSYLTNANAGAWSVNGYQGVLPYLFTGDTTLPIDTFCLVNNSSASQTGLVFVDVISSEGDITGLSNLQIGAIPPQKSQMIKFAGDSVFFDGTEGTHQLATMGTEKRYAARMTVTATPVNVTVNCFQVDPANGTKRVIPVYLDPDFLFGSKNLMN